jgi:hypothetical protein
MSLLKIHDYIKTNVVKLRKSYFKPCKLSACWLIFWIHWLSILPLSLPLRLHEKLLNVLYFPFREPTPISEKLEVVKASLVEFAEAIK